MRSQMITQVRGVNREYVHCDNAQRVLAYRLPITTTLVLPSSSSLETVKALRRADVQAELASQGASAIIDKGPEETAGYIKVETAKWGKVIKTLGSKVQWRASLHAIQ